MKIEETTRSELPYLLLGLLATGERAEGHGYHLKQAMRQSLGPFWDADIGQIYRTLAEMERAGWVVSHQERRERGPNRKIYQLTPVGRERWTRWLGEAPALRPHLRDEFYLKLYFLGQQNPARLAELLSGRQDQAEADVAEWAERLRVAQSSGDPVQILLAEAGYRHAEADLTWLAWCAALLGLDQPVARASQSLREATWVIRITGSHDPILDHLSQQLETSNTGVRLIINPVGSLEGLLALQRGEADAAGTHLLDVESGEYNIPFVRRLLPEEDCHLIHLAYREQGLMVAPGNPLHIQTLADLTRHEIRYVNRQKGTGTRLHLFHNLRQAGIDPRTIRGYDRELPTHWAVAAAIARGEADAGLGVAAAAAGFHLDFIPLWQERYDLVVHPRLYRSPRLAPLLSVLQSPSFRAEMAQLPGYDTGQMGVEKEIKD